MNHPIDPKHADTIQTEQDRWLKFFTEGERLDPEALPSWMHTEEMQQAMSTLKAFSDNERAYHAYQARRNYLREQRSIQRHLDELKAETEQQRVALEQALAREEQALAREEQERAAKEAALAEIARLKAQLKDPDHPQ